MNDTKDLALEADSLVVGYGAVRVLDLLDLQVRRGEVVALLGGNGAGKSTTLNAFLGFARPSAGLVKVCGIDVADDPLAARAKIAYVPENVALYEHLSARENMAYFLRLGGLAAAPAAVGSALAEAGLQAEAWDRRLATYSKGMRQKVAIAIALARSVPVLLLDEPTSGLDPQAASEFNALIQQLSAREVAVLMVTHDLLGAAEVADRIDFLQRGAIAMRFHAAEGERYDVDALYHSYNALGRSA
jgi:ABC-2 type transport system ATP-binding protein